MRKTRKILSILLACMMLTSLLSIGVVAAGTQDNPIDAATKWFGYGVDCYLLNPTIAEGSDGMWYTLTAENAGILSLEHSYKNVDYTIYVTLNGVVYEGGCVNGEPYNRPIVTAPIQVGDVATIQVITKDAAAGTVYASMNVISGDIDNAIKVKSNGLSVVVGAGKTVYFQDDSLNAIYATKGLLVEGDVANTTFYTVTKNSESGTAVEKPFTDSDADGMIEAKLGGSLGGSGAPAVKPAWAIENNSAQDQAYTLTIVDTAHECVYDNDTDTDCNTCGAIRNLDSCQHEYANDCDASCDLCGEERITEHTYSFDLDETCNVCNAQRDLDLPLAWGGSSISEDVNGLACRFDLQIEGMTTKNGTVAVYDDATFCGYKLITMGAIVCNNYMETNTLPTHADVDNFRVLDIPTQYLFNIDAETDTVSFATRVIDIPDEGKDTCVTFVPYVVLKDDEGNQHILYINNLAFNSTYNDAA